MGQKLESDKAQKLRTGYFQNLNNIQNAAQAGCSVGTAFNHDKKLEDEINEHGLMPILDKYRLPEARRVAILGESLKIHETTPEECYRGMPIVRKLAAGLIPIESMGTVIDQVFAACPPDHAREFGAAMLEYANERQQNGNLAISKLRTEYSTLTANCRTLGETQRTLTADVTRLESQRGQLVIDVNKFQAEQRGLSERLKLERQTDQTLKHYVYDKAQLKTLGVDIDNVGRARQFFGEMPLHNYNASYVAAQLMNNPTLSAVTRNLGQEVNDLVTRKAALTKEIEEIDAKRRAAERRAAEAEKDADAKIAESQKRISDKLELEKLTFADIEETQKFRTELKEAGFES